MKIARPAALIVLAAAAIASAAFAQTPSQYSQIRQAHPHINDAVAALPNSDFNSDGNRLSELWHRSQIQALGTGASAQLPANFLRNLDATLLDMAADLRPADLAGLQPDQLLYILQVIKVMAFQRTLDLYYVNSADAPNAFCYADQIIQPCDGGECPPCDEFADPSAYDRLDAILSAVRDAYGLVRDAAIEDYNPATDPDPNLTPKAEELNGNNFSLVTTLPPLMAVLGVESIDG